MKRTTLVSFVLITALTVACAPRKTVKKTSEETSSQETAENTPELDIRGTEFKETPELKTVYFELDKYDLDENARNTIQENSKVLKRNPEWEALIEGHCDERGTTQYNLALGQKRAKGVREYYIRLGIPGKRLATISYGEEKPICMDSGESCWSKNRRSETKVRARTADGRQEKKTE